MFIHVISEYDCDDNGDYENNGFQFINTDDSDGDYFDINGTWPKFYILLAVMITIEITMIIANGDSNGDNDQ